MRFRVYLCREKKAEQVIPRHHVPALAICEEIGEYDYETLLQRLPRHSVDKIMKSGVLDEPDEISKILSAPPEEGTYLRFVKL